MLKSIIFDFDGVLVDSHDFHLQKLNDEFGLRVPDDLFYKIHMGNFFEQLDSDSALGGIDWAAYHDAIYRDEIQQSLHPKLRAMLPELSEAHRLFIISSGSEHSIKGFLAHHRISLCFDAVLGLETSPSKHVKFDILRDSYDVDIEAACFITDTVGDIQEARVLPLRVVAIDFGYHKRADLEAAGPSFVCSNWDEVKEALASISGI